MRDDNCIFCKIAAGELPAEIVQEDEHTLAFMDINPWTRGHALVIPRNHSRNLYEAPEEDLEQRSYAYQRLQREVLHAQRRRVVELRNAGAISDDVMHALEREFDLEDERLEI